MPDVELVIKIPTAIYEASQILDVKYEDTVQIPLEVITNATPLQKGHGRIADIDAAIKCIEECEGDDAIWAISLIDWACGKRTIIEADKSESEEAMNEVGVEIVETEETKESEIKYLNVNISNSEVERNPDIVRLCADAGILEYAKAKTGNRIEHNKVLDKIRSEILEYIDDLDIAAEICDIFDKYEESEDKE